MPTLVEVKRGSDSRIRPEVIGQMLDYAVNGVVYWPLEQLCELFVRQCQRDGREPEAAVREVAGEEVGVEEFWQRVGDSLRAGKVRMVFVSDQIPRELRRVVEFLNGQMSPAEVLAIAVKQYVGTDGARTLVPRVIGQTAEVEARKGRRPSGERRRWDCGIHIRQHQGEVWGEGGAGRARAVRMDVQRGWRPTLALVGTGAQRGSWIPVLAAAGREHYPIALYSYGRIEVQFQHLKVRPPFDDERTRIELMHRLNEIPGVSFGRDVITRRPSIPLSLPANNSAAFEQLKRALEWVEERARGTEEQMTGA